MNKTKFNEELKTDEAKEVINKLLLVKSWSDYIKIKNYMENHIAIINKRKK